MPKREIDIVCPFPQVSPSFAREPDPEPEPEQEITNGGEGEGGVRGRLVLKKIRIN